MRRARLVNLALLAIVVSLAFALYITPADEPSVSRPKVIDIVAQEITELTITQSEKETFAFHRVDSDRWQMSQPVAISAASDALNGLLTLFELDSLGSFSAADRDLTIYGLAPPQQRLSINGEHELSIGDSTPLGNRRYLLYRGEVHTVLDQPYLIGGLPHSHYISRTLLAKGDLIVELHLPGVAIKQDANGWQAAPRAAHSSLDALVQQVAAWERLTALQVEPYDHREGKPVTLTLASGELIRLLITAVEPNLILARPAVGIQYHLPGELADPLLGLK